MVSVLDSESKLRNLAVVSREGQAAAYRVRFYLAAEVVRGKTMIAWVWDVYDRDQQRALHVSGFVRVAGDELNAVGVRRRGGKAQGARHALHDLRRPAA